MCTLSKRTPVITLTPVNCPFVNRFPYRCSSAWLYLFPTDPNARKKNFREEDLDKRASYLTWFAGEIRGQGMVEERLSSSIRQLKAEATT